MNASTYWLLTRYIAAIVQTSNQAAVFAVVAGRHTKRIDTLAPSWLLLVVTLPILAAMRAILNLDRVDVHITKRIWTVVFIARVSMDAVGTGASTQ